MNRNQLYLLLLALVAGSVVAVLSLTQNLSFISLSSAGWGLLVGFVAMWVLDSSISQPQRSPEQTPAYQPIRFNRELLATEIAIAEVRLFRGVITDVTGSVGYDVRADHVGAAVEIRYRLRAALIELANHNRGYTDDTLWGIESIVDELVLRHVLPLSVVAPINQVLAIANRVRLQTDIAPEDAVALTRAAQRLVMIIDRLAVGGAVPPDTD